MGWISGNRYLSQTETDNNAVLILDYFRMQGWTMQAICAMLGNMQAESGCNPGIWESLQPYQGGYGLTQWTPYIKYSGWYGTGWEDNGPGECSRIIYESTIPPGDPDSQWFRNNELGIDPPITFEQFTTSTLPLNDLTNYWLWFYEHPDDPGPITQAVRQVYANRFWNMFYSSVPVWLICRMAQLNNLFNRR